MLEGITLVGCRDRTDQSTYSKALGVLQAEPAPSSPGSRHRLILFGILAVAVCVTLPPQLFPSQQVMKNYRLLDTSWQLSMPMKFGEGELSGRDFIYTYGPVYQLTQSLGLLIPPGDLASVARFRSLPGQLIVLGGLWWVLGLTGCELALSGNRIPDVVRHHGRTAGVSCTANQAHGRAARGGLVRNATESRSIPSHETFPCMALRRVGNGRSTIDLVLVRLRHHRLGRAAWYGDAARGRYPQVAG